MNTRALREYRNGLNLSVKQCEMLTGMLLGDAHLEQQSSKTARLKIEHCIRQQEYVAWKYDMWKERVLTPPQLKSKQDRLGSASINVWFNTISHSELFEWHSRFYTDCRKTVPKDLALTPLALAVWFMDDGSRKSRECRGLYLNVQCYRQSEVEMLRTCLERDFELTTTTRQQADGLQIYFPSSEAPSFTEIVKPHLLESMMYKLSC